MVEGQVFLWGGGELLALFPLKLFKVYHFYTQKLLSLPFAKLCYAFEEKLFFSATIIL